MKNVVLKCVKEISFKSLKDGRERKQKLYFLINMVQGSM